MQSTLSFNRRFTARRSSRVIEPLIVDNFAGGGGASLGIELALGRAVDISINHDPSAVEMHTANHPASRHACENVWKVDPKKITRGRPVGLAWFSPDCRHFSRAKGGAPVSPRVRGLAWIVVKWAKLVKPEIIILENVREFEDWGPLKQVEGANGDKLAAEERQLRIDWYKAAAESRMDDKAYRTAYLDHLSELRQAVQVLAGVKEETEATS